MEPEELMEQLHDLFGNLCVRLESMGKGDAHVNGVVILHSLAMLFTLSGPELITAVVTESTTSDDSQDHPPEETIPSA
jgi:hypothetical protein